MSASSAKSWGNQRSARVAVAAALLIKLALVVWNASTYNSRSYDYHWHRARVASAGLHVDAMAYNPPLYYLPCLPFVDDVPNGRVKEGFTRDDLMGLLRFTNIAYLFLFYVSWIYFIIPKLITGWRGATIASLVILCFPGFQKLGVMTHPDNLLVGLSALGLAYWLWFRKRPFRAGWRDWTGVTGFGLIVGLIGMTRPFAAVPVFVLSLAGLIALVRERGLFSWAFLSRATLFTVLAGTLSLSWYVYRWHEIGTFKAGYSEKWVGKFREYRDDLDRVHYFTNFYFTDLLREPNMLNEAFGYNGKPKVTNDMSNSFPTIAYSEFWGDHWLYFSSPKYRTEGKRWPKRILFVIALLMLPLLGLRFVGGVVTTGRRLARGDPDADADALLVLYFLLGMGLYFHWLMGDALLPGANTPIKFIYNAHLAPVFVTVAFLKDLGPRQFNAWLGYAGLVFLAALPVATFWPF
jgi:hypothetical protein